jgi:hypothetical protein
MLHALIFSSTCITMAAKFETPRVGYAPDLDAAREEAIHVARDLAAEIIGNGDLLDLGGRIEIADEDGNALVSVVFRDALPIKMP